MFNQTSATTQGDKRTINDISILSIFVMIKSDLEKRNRLERARIIQKMLLEKEKGRPVSKFKHKKERFYHCDSVGEEGDIKTNMH